MTRKIVFFENHFIEFYQKQDEKVKGKIQYVFEIIRQVERVPEKFLKHLSGTDGLSGQGNRLQKSPVLRTPPFQRGNAIHLLIGSRIGCAFQIKSVLEIFHLVKRQVVSDCPDFPGYELNTRQTYIASSAVLMMGSWSFCSVDLKRRNREPLYLNWKRRSN